jgi:hypothetical protein
MVKPIQITVGGAGQYDPAAGGTDYVNASLSGQDGYVFRSGYGPLPYGSYDVLPSGGFRLKGPAVVLSQVLGTEDPYTGNVFRPGEMYTWQSFGLLFTNESDGYTNGFDFARVMSAMYGRIGWRQPEAAGSPVVASTNLIAKSGRHFQDFHALVSVANVKATIEEAGADDTNLNIQLEQLQRAAILRCLNAVFREREYLDQSLLYTRLERQQVSTVENEGLFVGYLIKVGQANDISTQIESVTLNFDTDKTFTLYLFAEGKKTAIWSQSVDAVGGEATQVVLDGLVLNYLSNHCKRFFFGYFQDDLGSTKAVKEQATWSTTRCFSAQPVQSAKVGADLNREQFSLTNTPYGLNLEVTSFRDHTQSIVRKASLFDEAVGLTHAYMVIEQILTAARSNATERLLKDAIDKVGMQLELTGAAPISDSPKIQGMTGRIDQELKRLRLSFFPKPKSQVVNYGCFENEPNRY